MKKKIIFLVFVLYSISNYTQEKNYLKKIDSLKGLIIFNKKDSTTIKNLNLLADEYYKVNLDSAILYSNKAINRNNEKFPKLLVNSYKMLGSIEFNKSNFNGAIKFFNKALEVCISSNLKKGEALFLNNIGLCYKILGDYSKTMEFYQKSLQIKREISDFRGEIITLKNICGLYYELDKFEEGVSTGKEALKLCGTKFPDLKSKILNNIGSNYLELKNYNEALIYYEKAFDLVKNNKSDHIYTLTLHNIANVHTFLGQHKLAMLKFEEVLDLKKKKGNKVSIAKSEMGIGILAFEMKDFKKSIKHLINSDKIHDDLNKPFELISTNLYLAKAYKSLNLNLKAYQALNKSYNVRDSLFYADGLKEVEEIEAKYKTQQKENQILKLENEAQQKELVLQESKTKTNYAIASIFLVILGGGLYLRKRKKDQKLKILEASLKSGEEEKIRIGRELHDHIASDLRKLAHNIKSKDVSLSHKLLNSYNSIRDLSHQLNDTPLHGEIFMDSIFELMPKNNENQKFDLKIEPPYLELQEPYSTHLYRIIQELFTNNLKYAKATQTNINVSLEDNLLVLHYKDNGVGATNLKKGTGLKNIENRILLLKGKTSMNSDNGFSMNIEIPYKK